MVPQRTRPSSHLQQQTTGTTMKHKYTRALYDPRTRIFVAARSKNASFVEAGLMGKEHHHEEHDHGEGHENGHDHDKKDHDGNKEEPQDPKLRAAEVKAAARSAFGVAFIGFMAASSEWMSAYVGYQMDVL